MELTKRQVNNIHPIQITTAEFIEDTVSFSVNHLTTFGVWGVTGAPEVLETESTSHGGTGGAKCTNFFVCYWWVLIIIIILIFAIWKYSSYSKYKV